MPDHSEEISEDAQDASRPKVVSVTPANGAESVPATTELRVRFDRPMDPLELKLDWESGGFLSCDFPGYNPQTYEFTIPLRLAAGKHHQIVVNSPFIGGDSKGSRSMFPCDGFQSADHRSAGMFVWQFQTEPERRSAGGAPPKVISISPPPGSLAGVLTFVEVQFDQAMTSPAEALPYIPSMPGTGPELLPRVEYDASKHSFRLPIIPPAEQTTKFTLTGFRGESGARAEPIKLAYQTSREKFTADDQAKIAAAARDPRLLSLLEKMGQKRLDMTSVSERVQTIEMGQKNDAFTSLSSRHAEFKWRKPDHFYGDIAQEMSLAAFRAGSDGRNWWFHRLLGKETTLEACPVAEVKDVNVSFCDPFKLTRKTPAKASSDLGLSCVGGSKTDGSDPPLVQAYRVNLYPGLAWGEILQWSIDSRDNLPQEIAQYSPSSVRRTRFLYDCINQPLPEEAFDVPKVQGVSAGPPEALDADYTGRSITIRDGSDGGMSLYWSREGPKGSIGAGMR